MFNNILKRNEEIVAYFGITERKLMKVYIIKNKDYIYIKKFILFYHLHKILNYSHF